MKSAQMGALYTGLLKGSGSNTNQPEILKTELG